VTEEISEMFTSSSKPSPVGGLSATHFGDEESDDSQHSSHPMVTSGTSSSSTTKSSGKTKLSAIKSSSASSKRSSGSKKASGYTSTNFDERDDL
jgi:hypothetical protein